MIPIDTSETKGILYDVVHAPRKPGKSPRNKGPVPRKLKHLMAPACRMLSQRDGGSRVLDDLRTIDASPDTGTLGPKIDGGLHVVEQRGGRIIYKRQTPTAIPGTRGGRNEVECATVSLKELSTMLGLSDSQAREISIVDSKFPMKIPLYYARLMVRHEALRPVVVPSVHECITYENDAATDVHADESKYQPVEGIVHRYPGKLLFFPTLQCFGHCRFCFRAGHRVRPLSEAKINGALEYIRANRAIREVLITGGDPLKLTVEALDNIMRRLRAIDHVEIIRIGTRALSYAPDVITPELVSMLRKYSPVFMTLSFVHPDEITPYCEQKLNMLADAGIVMLQQGPLLKGVNDDSAVLKKMYEKLARNRVLAYYAIYGIYAPGVRHFIVTREEARALFGKLENNTSGHCLPHLITLNQNDDKTRSVI